MLKVSLALSSYPKLNKFIDKECFFRTLRIMKRARKQYEDLHWNYKWHFSTRWMGIDKKAVTVLKSGLDSDEAISDDNQ